ncbi:response regulator transcription factor [Aquimarina sp. MAR_2010_214]|uniref:response regulator transcription factor n=1 Tax=Aquimarina sp. MAR_2010_214 TaxID=1250026 RepID=UPI0027153DFF|nr:LuxR C-terminal-related transcriptional regulator [Aquimarina sp. MAR_2010_214]
MKNWSNIFVFLFLLNINLFGQDGISGYVHIEDPQRWGQTVYLSQIQLEENTNTYNTTTIASTLLTKDGFFAFDKNLFTSKDHIYKVQLNPISAEEKNKLSDKIKNFQLFILSKKDTIHFTKGERMFGEYTTNNTADLEWQKLKQFEAKYENLTDDFDPRQYLIETKGYVKDSLQILLVKLIGIKKLDDQNLLEKDAKANPEYYLSFLKELKSSELDPSTYAYLENKLNFITQEIVNHKYKVSLWVNGATSLVIILLIGFILKSRRTKKVLAPIPLSKQEKAVKNLIISGKSNKEIANELFISLSTVKTHITNIYSKLNISSRQDLLLKK